MAEADKILSQHEVDALLSAIDSGEVEVSAQASSAVGQAMPYDFKRPERVAREQLRAIETLHEVYARNLQGALSGTLRTVVDVKIASVDQMTFLEFINSLPNPTVFTVLSCDPLEGNFIFEMNPTIAFPIIERLLGSGKIGASQPERALTEIEWNLVINRIMGKALDLMKEVWIAIAPVSFKVTAQEANPQLRQIFSPNEAVVSVVLEVSMGEHKGYINICLPVMAIEAHMEKITSHTSYASRKREQSPSQESMVARQLAPAEVQVTAHLPIESMLMRELEALGPGDVLLTSHPWVPWQAPVLFSVEGRPKFQGKLGSLKDRFKAVKVLGFIDPARESTILQPRTAVSVAKGEASPAAPAKGEGEGEPSSVSGMRVENLLRVSLQATVVLAEKTMRIRDVVAFRVGEIVEFARRVEEPLPMRVGDRPIAEGTAVKIGEKFGLQVNAIREPRETVRALGP